MNTETIQLSNGYTAKIATDDCPENPWTAWDCQPPIMVFNDYRIDDYKTGLSLPSLYELIPLDFFTDKRIHLVLSALNLENVDHEGYDDTPKGWKEAVSDYLPEAPTGWRDAIEYFGMCEAICVLAGIECLNEQSNGYSQGHSSRVFMAATPEWRKRMGIDPETVIELKGSLMEWAAWAWGDVYGVAEIIRPDGTECDEGGCWGFYGSDHKESGLLEHAESVVQADMLEQEREEREAFRAACSDIATV